jgi:hypothetical protein
MMIAMSFALSVPVLAGEIPSVGTPSPAPAIPTDTTAPGEIPSGGITTPGEIPCGDAVVSAILSVLGLVTS